MQTCEQIHNKLCLVPLEAYFNEDYHTKNPRSGIGADFFPGRKSERWFGAIFQSKMLELSDVNTLHITRYRRCRRNNFVSEQLSLSKKVIL